MNKQNLFRYISETIAEKSMRLQQDIADLQKDIAEDSKSSAGDKFETSREMAQQELGKLSTQLAEQQRLKKLLENQSTETSSCIKVGSLVQTNLGTFLVGIPIGKITFGDTSIIGIGVGAPLGQLLLNKSENDRIAFNHQNFLVEKIS